MLNNYRIFIPNLKYVKHKELRFFLPSIQHLSYSENLIQTEYKSKRGNIYLPKEKIIFESGKALVFQSYPGLRMLFRSLSWLTFSGCLFSGYKLISSMMALSPYYSTLWGLCGLFSFYLYKNTGINRKAMIFSIYLLDDGKSIQITFFDNNSIVEDIMKVRRMSKKGLMVAYATKSIHMKRCYPFTVGNYVYLLSKDYDNVNKELLSVISNGSYISVDDKVKKRQKVINIKSE